MKNKELSQLKDEELLQLAVDNPDFLCVSGSHLYGMSTPGSDLDIRGFVVPPFSYLIGVKKFICQEFDEDTKIYSVAHFLKLVLKGDPLCNEMLFIPYKLIKKCSSVGKHILSLKDDIVSSIDLILQGTNISTLSRTERMAIFNQVRKSLRFVYNAKEVSDTAMNNMINQVLELSSVKTTETPNVSQMTNDQMVNSWLGIDFGSGETKTSTIAIK